LSILPKADLHAFPFQVRLQLQTSLKPSDHREVTAG